MKGKKKRIERTTIYDEMYMLHLFIGLILKSLRIVSMIFALTFSLGSKFVSIILGSTSVNIEDAVASTVSFNRILVLNILIEC